MLTIGQMSKACGVTVKTLHHYDKIGLLKAVQTDPFTGYRYYSEEQISIMLLINRLKRYGFSLSDIQNLILLKDVHELKRQLRFQKLRLEQEQAHLSASIQEIQLHLEEFEKTNNIMSYQNKYEVVLKQSEELSLITSRQNMSVNDFQAYYGNIYERIAKKHLTPSRLSLAIYYDEDFDPANSDIELGIEILEKDKADKILESTFCATTIHKGAYSSLSDAYGKVYAWIKQNGYQLIHAPFEIYRKNAFDGLPVCQWETEVFFPIEK